eukprot:gene10037-12306_t
MANNVIIQTPIRLLDKLSTINQNEHGDTPRPAISMLTFISGMQAIDKNPKLAFEKLSLSVQQAEKSDNKEELAVSLLGLGYSFYLRKEFDKATQLYCGSLDLWKQIHGSQNMNITQLLSDIGQLYEIQSNTTKSNLIVQEIKDIYKKNNKEFVQPSK